MITGYSPQFQNQLIQIANLTLGPGYLSDKDLQKKDSIVLLEIEENKVRGFCLGLCISPKDLFRDFRIPVSLNEMEKDKKIGLLKTIATAPDCQKQGLGLTLINSLLQKFEENGISKIVCPAWKTGSKINLAGILNRTGFHQTREIPDYWYEDSLEKKYPCPECGQPPCRCAAIIFER